jgi:hypothetical protein
MIVESPTGRAVEIDESTLDWFDLRGSEQGAIVAFKDSDLMLLVKRTKPS